MEGINYSIGEVSERLEVSYRTLHYYEKKFNLQINRDGAGNRIYSEKNIELLEQILQLKQKGMSLDGIKALLQEKGIIEVERNDVIVVDDNTMQLKEFMLDEIKQFISQEIRQELQETKDLLKQVIADNKELKEDNTSLREDMRKIQRQNDDHFKKLDQRLTEWRTKKQPWYKNFFNKNTEEE